MFAKPFVCNVNRRFCLPTGPGKGAPGWDGYVCSMSLCPQRGPNACSPACPSPVVGCVCFRGPLDFPVEALLSSVQGLRLRRVLLRFL